MRRLLFFYFYFILNQRIYIPRGIRPVAAEEERGKVCNVCT